MNIFNTQAELKEKAQIVLSLLINDTTFKKSSIIQALVSKKTKAELHFAEQVSKELLNVDKTRLSLGRVQQSFARKSNGIDYQTFKARTFENKLDARRFLNMKFSVGNANWLSSEIIHPFPPEFEKFSILQAWKPVWEKLNISTKDRPFLAPAIPPDCFLGNNIRTEQYQDWLVGKRVCKTYGNAGVIVYNNNRVVGTMRWYWWGHGESFKASDFSFYLIFKNKLISSQFDIRPSHEFPTFGPYIEVEELSPESLANLKLEENHIKSIRFAIKN